MVKYFQKMEFKWLNESTIEKSENRIIIMAPGKTDFFRGNEENNENKNIDKKNNKENPNQDL